MAGIPHCGRDPATLGAATPEDSVLAMVLGIPLLVACAYMVTMLLIKRSHDLNRSGHFCWLLLVPLVSIWPMLELFVFEGTSGSNRFGPDMMVSPDVPMDTE